MNQYKNFKQAAMAAAILQDCESMAALNDKVYPKEWHVSPDLLKEILQVNPEIYRILKTPEGVKGMYSLIPLNQEAYSAVLEGRLSEYEIGEHLLTYNQPKEVYLYFITLIVDIHDDRCKEYASMVIKDIPNELVRLREKGIEIKEIGGFAVSSEGAKVLPKMGFTNEGETVIQNGQEYPVFRAKPEQVIKSIV
ncbi:hypothetical protein [Niallia endozanthoxylica]|uniref:Uncharacterized protein n=1 Tax=Niallia endozanthoxylica TaxID=2036016 RepID=A0A5J5I785_9BACI|nr:hypothetical protein [Niallia endozanthoxylica]KAA9029997.1 hypothetical protein F4V44_03045 [Niallia endozanthoxylica]